MGVETDLDFTNAKTPPGWNGRNMSHRQWTQRTKRWIITTSEPKKKQGGLITLRLFGAPGRHAANLADDELEKEDGAQWLMTQFDHFKEYSLDEAYKDVKKFLRRVRYRGEDIKSFVIDWETLRARSEEHGFAFTGGLDAFLLIEASGCTEESVTRLLGQLVDDIEFTTVKKYLLRTMQNVSNSHSASAIEDEGGSCFFAGGDEREEEEGWHDCDEEDEDPYLTYFEFDVPPMFQDDFSRIYAAFQGARRQLQQFRPRRKYKYRQAPFKRRMNTHRKGGGLFGRPEKGKGKGKHAFMEESDAMSEDAFWYMDPQDQMAYLFQKGGGKGKRKEP
jgi:hypothetical protein